MYVRLERFAKRAYPNARRMAPGIVCWTLAERQHTFDRHCLSEWHTALEHENVRLLHHLRHCEAFFGALAARLCACDHLLVVRHFLAGGSALFTTFGATLCCNTRESALSSAQGRAHLAALGAIDTEMHALGVILFPLAHERSAVMEARIALNLAIRTHGRALQQVSRVGTVIRDRGRTRHEDS